ncbi:AAC(3) family N-acetyltransferase [Alkalibacterium sp. 20]|uniref:AAC(3) family N-acetyltransferase n=1 Tax=Alkalibacterium sp. 20 TaxID=1798803 RepID=UPI0009000094|nr:AAC(3) family N-acetyltransferase [Alkalibacterium sp. 20]OJF95944.1 aminoglycoside 3-N-acetyltransferase [Alkalibacterium sp. 20]
MHTKESLLNDLKKLKLNPEGTLLVHSSYKSIGEVAGGPETVLDSLSAFMKEGLLVLPTHTWEYISKEKPVFDVKNSPSNVGILTEKFRQRENVCRSEHPTHSVAALGMDAQKFTDGEYKHETACARDSVWGKIVDRKADILLIGVDLTKNTFIHGIEEWVGIPGRLKDTHDELYSILHSGKKVQVPTRRHQGLSWSDHFWKVEEILLEEGAMKKGTFGDATVRVVDAEKTAELLTELLQVNPDLFSDNEPLSDKWRYYFQNQK